MAAGTLAASDGSAVALAELVEEDELDEPLELVPPSVLEPHALRASPAVASPVRSRAVGRRRWVMR
jgi:hypothetical protein